MTLALILAAGSGERLGADRPKALVELAGRPMLAWSLQELVSVASVERIVLALPPALVEASGRSDDWRLPRELDGRALPELSVVAGGGSRSESVLAALGSVTGAAGETVLIHDAARPLVSTALAERVLGALEADAGADCAIAVTAVTDTIKRVEPGEVVVETLDRASLRAVQTPQVFRREALERGLARARADGELARATDDAWLIERCGGRVLVVDSGGENLKVTTPLDLRVAELLLAGRDG
ncbi:MAG TPA: 2-C-methyl-D-erythritol 4-phosphate cytidylyltransferase [Solirubrobacteraceae bacterium]|jgi:2-C-methyl-D-erythritol 4-phosphate cytidylyltransferase